MCVRLYGYIADCLLCPSHRQSQIIVLTLFELYSGALLPACLPAFLLTSYNFSSFSYSYLPTYLLSMRKKFIFNTLLNLIIIIQVIMTN